MHIDHELIEFVPVDEQEYEEEIIMQEGAPEPFGVDLSNTSPTEGKPRCINPIL